MLRIRQFLALARLTALEAARQPICLLLATTCIVLIGLGPLLQMHMFGEDGKLVRDSALALHFVFGLFVAGQAASASLSREIRRGTVSAVLSKPVGRDLFFLSKFAGVAVVVLAFSGAASIATLLSERAAEKFVLGAEWTGYLTDYRIGGMLLAAPGLAYLVAGFLNYRRRRPFGSAAFALLLVFLAAMLFAGGFIDRHGSLAPFDCRVEWRLLPASLLITMALLVLAAIALSLSTRLGPTPTLTLCGAVFAVGLVSDYAFGGNPGSLSPAVVLYWLIPNWQHFWVCDALTGGGTIPGAYLAGTGLYALAYTAAVLSLGIVSFRGADMK